MKLRKYKIERIEVDSIEVELPTEPLYLFETGVRRSIRIVPQYTSWRVEQGESKEEIYSYEVTMVYLSSECRVELFEINPSDIEGLYYSNATMRPAAMESQAAKIIVDRNANTRTKEQFDTDLKAAFERFMSPQS